jgi:hypothetical protein
MKPQSVADASSEPSFLNDAALRESPRLKRLLAMAGRTMPPRLAVRLAARWEGGPCYSRTWRRLLWELNGVAVGAYSYGSLMELSSHPRPGLSIGRYVSISTTARWGLDHPLDRVSTSPLFSGQFFPGCDSSARIDPPPVLEICHDAWIGEYVVIMPGCRRIGIGAVVGAGSIVTHDVPDFAIVVGAPARVRRYRVDEAQQEKILKSRWWELNVDQLRPWREMMARGAGDPGFGEALLQIKTLAQGHE